VLRWNRVVCRMLVCNLLLLVRFMSVLIDVVRACAGQTFHPKWPSSTLHDLVPPLLSLLISSCPPSHIPPTSFYLCLQPSTSIVLHADTQLPSLVSSTCPNLLSLLFKSLPYILQIPFHSLMDPSFDVLHKEL